MSQSASVAPARHAVIGAGGREIVHARFATPVQQPEDASADLLVPDLVPLAQGHMVGPVHVAHEVQSRSDGCDAPIAFELQPVLRFQLRLDGEVDTPEAVLVGRQEHHIVHIAIIVLHAEHLLHPVVEVCEHERREYLAGVHPYRKASATGRIEDERMDQVQSVSVLDLALDELEQLLPGDVVEVLRDILLKVVFRTFRIRIDVRAHPHGAHMRTLALLGRIGITDAGPQQDGSDHLQHGMLHHSVRVGDGIAEMPFLSPLEYIAGSELGETERLGTEDRVDLFGALQLVLQHLSDLRILGMALGGVVDGLHDVASLQDALEQRLSIDVSYPLHDAFLLCTASSSFALSGVPRPYRCGVGSFVRP